MDDREDINSMCLTAVQRLLETYGECGAALAVTEKRGNATCKV